MCDKDTNVPNKTDYISQEAAVEAAVDYRVDVIENDYDRGYQRAVRDIAKELNSIPAADVRPVVRGRWEIMSDPRFRCCSVCHDKVVFNMKNYPNFCDVCGADMRPNLDTTKGDNHGR